MKCADFCEALVDQPRLWERAALALHARRCAPCRARLAETRAIGEAIRELPRRVPPESLYNRLLGVSDQPEEVSEMAARPSAKGGLAETDAVGRARPTLRQTLMVAGILAILSVILFPVARFVRDRRVAQQEAAATYECQQHAKALTLALLMYAHEHRGRLPNAWTWLTAVAPYLDDAAASIGATKEEILSCPVDPWPDSYWMAPDLSGVDVNSISDPGRTPLLYERTAGYLGPDGQVLMAPRHPAGDRNGSVVGYLDGHVAWVPFSLPVLGSGDPIPPGAW